MKFHQVVAGPLPDKNIAALVSELHALFGDVGDAFVYSEHYVDGLPLAALQSAPGTRGDVIVVHIGIGSLAAVEMVLTRPERLVVICHGVPDSAAYVPFDPLISGLVASAHNDLARLVDRADLVIAFTAAAAEQLASAGHHDVVVLNPVFDAARLAAVEPFAPTLNHFDTAVSGPVITLAGAVLPHLQVERLLQGYNLLVTHLLPEANLVVVGLSPLPKYHRYLDQIVKSLNLHKAALFGEVSDAELAATYRSSDVAVVFDDSSDEALQAMAFGLPVLTVTNDLDATVIAEGMFEALTNQELRDQLVADGSGKVTPEAIDVARANLLIEILAVIQ